MIAVNDINRYELHFRQFMLMANTVTELWGHFLHRGSLFLHVWGEGCLYNNNNNNNNIYLKSNIHSIIRYKFSGLYNGIKHGIHIKTVQCI